MPATKFCLKRIVHLTSAHPFDDTRIFHKMCKSLASGGFPVTLIAQRASSEIIDGIDVISLSIPKNRFERMTRTTWQVYRAALLTDGAIYHFHDPELILIGILLKFHGKIIIYDVHEDYAASLNDNDREWLPSYLGKFASVLTRAVEIIGAHFFDAIVAATDQISNHFPKNKTIVVNNYPIYGELITGSSKFSYRNRPYNVAYIGLISKLRGVREMIDALSLLPANYNAKLQLAGVFDQENLKKEILELETIKSFSYLGVLSRKDVAYTLEKVRAGLVLFHPAQNHIKSQPNKLFEYLSAGIPIIASDFPLWRDFILGTGCGLTVNPLDPMEIAKAMLWIFSHPEEAEEMGKRGQDIVAQKLNWTYESKKIFTLYETLLS